MLSALVAAGATAFACSDAPVENGGSSQQAINGTSCTQVVLDASRSYNPNAWSDGQQSLGGRMAFSLPAEIPLSAGAPGNHKAVLTLGDGATSIECIYKGNGIPNVDDSDDDNDDSGHGGTAFVFSKCKGKAGKNLSAGSPVTADRFGLHVKNGDHAYGITTAHLVIDEARPCDPVTRGDVNFHDRALAGLGGNGRACSDCHVDADSFQLSPATANARWIALQAAKAVDPEADDPLFRPIDANDFRTNGEAASDFTNLRAGFVRVTMSLPANVSLLDGAGNPTPERTVDVWRAVPSINNVAITGADNGPAQLTGGPNPFGGYQLDGRAATLPLQAQGALTAHAQTTTAAPSAFLDDLAAWQSTKFSSAGVASLASVILSGGTSFPDPDPVLDGDEEAGKVTFQKACAHCHGSAAVHPSTTTPLPGVLRLSNIATKCPPPVVPPKPQPGPPVFDVAFSACGPIQMSNVRVYRTQVGPTAFVVHPPTDDPGRLLLTGNPGDFMAFDTMNLHGIANTAPYFHNNRVDTLAKVVDHYFAFNTFLTRTTPPTARPAAISSDGVTLDRVFTLAEKDNLVKYLNKL